MTKPLRTSFEVLDERAPRVTIEADDIRRDRSGARQHILMCAPEHFDVSYVINPWMEDQIGRAVRSLACDQWANLRRLLGREAEIALITQESGLPDMVFSANAGVVIGDRAVVSRFRTAERQPEEALFRAWFERRGFDVVSWPEDVPFEGAGDALLDRAQPILWCGYGMRSGAAAPEILERAFGRRTVGLRLVDPRFYHLDTCFCPLEGGWLMYYPPAFDVCSRETIATLVPSEKRIDVTEGDALLFACNAVDVNKRVFMNDASPSLQSRLRAAGFIPTLTPLSEFLKAGGAAKCLTLKLVEN